MPASHFFTPESWLQRAQRLTYYLNVRDRRLLHFSASTSNRGVCFFFVPSLPLCPNSALDYVPKGTNETRGATCGNTRHPRSSRNFPVSRHTPGRNIIARKTGKAPTHNLQPPNQTMVCKRPGREIITIAHSISVRWIVLRENFPLSLVENTNNEDRDWSCIPWNVMDLINQKCTTLVFQCDYCYRFILMFQSLVTVDFNSGGTMVGELLGNSCIGFK